MNNMNEFVWEKYFEVIQDIVDKVKDTQKDNMKTAAEILTECTINDGIIHTFGTGHSHIIAEDVFWRAATLANVHAILEPSLTGSTEISKSERTEKLEGMGEIIVKYHKILPPDAIIIISNSGNNAAAIEVAMEAKKRDVKVIAITSVEYSNYLNSLHSSGKKLKDAADVVIDTCTPIGDAALKLNNFDIKVGGTSTIPGAFVTNALLAQVADNLIKKNIIPDVYYNGNLVANSKIAEEHNEELIEKYRYRIRNL